MKNLSLVTAAVAVCSLLTGNAVAQGVVRAAPASPYYVSQDETAPSPSDIVLPTVDESTTFSKDSKSTAGQKCGCGLASKDGKGGKCATCCDGEIVPFELIPETCSGIKVGGWTQIGYHSNTSQWDGFTDYPDHLALNQQWLYMEKVADGSCGLDWGFRADIMYGIDANNTQAFGNNPGVWDYQNGLDHGPYGFALPQMYAEVAYGDLSIIAGHFYTLIGYEVVTSPDNFFYSHAFTMNNSEPFTHTGALATYTASDNLTLYGGWTLGWDTGFDQVNSGSNWLGGFSYALGENINFTYMSTAGNFGNVIGREAYSHSIVLDVAVTERLNYVFQSDLLHSKDSIVAGAPNYETVGINQYLIYSLNDCWGFGARVEWWKRDGVSHNEATFGVNWTPHTNVRFRPEIRREWTPDTGYVEDIFACDMIITY